MPEKEESAKDFLFAGLKNHNTGFDSPLIPHVSAEDFQIVIKRCAATNTELIGIEVFEAGKYLIDIVISPELGLDWAKTVASNYTEQANITLCATFGRDGEHPLGNADASFAEALGGAPAEQDE